MTTRAEEYPEFLRSYPDRKPCPWTITKIYRWPSDRVDFPDRSFRIDISQDFEFRDVDLLKWHFGQMLKLVFGVPEVVAGEKSEDQ